jgi:(p)ppGpp synthase/HD superfamily hydrolase
VGAVPQSADTYTPSFLCELPVAHQAYAYALEAHGDQRRDSDAAGFIIHPLEVASLLYNTGHPDHVVAAGILHDTVERSATTIETIETRFGSAVAALVAAMTEDLTIADFKRRKAALRRTIAEFGPDAAAVYAADKVAKVRELRSRATRGEAVLDPRHRAGQEKLEHYLESVKMLEMVTPEHPLVRQLRFELEILRALPPRPDLLAITSTGSRRSIYRQD